jgi:hypothetical protein
MRNAVLLIGMAAVSLSLASEAIKEKYATNANCKACHTDLSVKWETSRHAHSHFTKNDLYNRTLEYMVKNDILKTKEEIVVECAKCHNPRIEKHKVGKSDKLNLLLDIDKSSMDKVLNNPTMRNGINCIVCHNVDRIHWKKDGRRRGFDAVEFGPQGTMFGPFAGAKSPYHRTEKRDFFVKDPNRLCLACHYSDTNRHGLEIYSTGKEYESVKKNAKAQQCISCHMSGKKAGVASNFSGKGGRVKRMVRDHLFASIDNSDIHRKYLDIFAESRNGKLWIRLKNRSPHRIPTGYGLRELELKVDFFAKGEKKIKTVNRFFKAVWGDRDKKPTVPHLAVTLLRDGRIAPGQEVMESFGIPDGTRLVNYRLIYRQIDVEMAKKLGVTDHFFTKEFVLKNGVVEP